MQYPNLAKESQTNANAYEKLAQPSTNCMQAALAAMGWAALCPSSTLTFYKQRERETVRARHRISGQALGILQMTRDP